MRATRVHRDELGTVIQIGWFVGSIVPIACLLMLAGLLWQSTKRVDRLRADLREAVHLGAVQDANHVAQLATQLGVFDSRLIVLGKAIDKIREAVVKEHSGAPE